MNRGTVSESITVTDNRTGETREIAIQDGGVAASEFSRAVPGIWFYDPGFLYTAAAESSITFVDGDLGILRYRGYPIEQLAEHSTYLEVAYLLNNGELPTEAQAAVWEEEVTHHTYIHENVRKRFLEGFNYDAHPMGMLVSAIAALSTYYKDAKILDDPEILHRQVVRLIAKMPTLAAAAHRFSVGMPFVYPDNTLGYTENFLSMMWKVAEPRYEPDPILAHALDVLFILHADHEQNCGTTAMRVVGSSHGDPYSATAAATAALYGPRHGGANEAVLKMLTKIGSIENIPAYIETVKQGKALLEGFGHRVYKNFDPRATIIKKTADEVFSVTGKNPLVGHRAQARGDRARRRLLHLASPLPERGLLLRFDLPGHGLPARDAHRAVRDSAHVGLARALPGAPPTGREDRATAPALHRRRGAQVRADVGALLVPTR